MFRSEHVCAKAVIKSVRQFTKSECDLLTCVAKYATNMETFILRTIPGIILRKFCTSSKPKVWNVVDEKTTAFITSSHSSNNKIDNLIGCTSTWLITCNSP